MLFLLGEKAVRYATHEGTFNCPICNSSQDALHVVEKNYFTVFFIRILPLEILSDYIECAHCQHSFDPQNTAKPAYISGLELVLSYLMLGYGVNESKEIATDIFKAMTEREYDEKIFRDNIADLNNGKDLFKALKGLAFQLNTMGTIRVVEAAFLMSRALSDLGYEDRLRVNLIGNALGISLEFINEIIDRIQQIH